MRWLERGRRLGIERVWEGRGSMEEGREGKVELPKAGGEGKRKKGWGLRGYQGVRG